MSDSDGGWEYSDDEAMEDFEDDDDDHAFFHDDSQIGNSSAIQEVTYIPLTSEAIEGEQKRLIQQVVDLTQLQPHVARQLLQEKRWNYEELAELYFEDPEKLMAKAGAAMTGEAVDSHVGASQSSLIDGGGEVTCQLCFDSFEGEEAAQNMTRIDVCGHMFCNECWRHHLKVRIHDEGEGAKIMCAGESQLENGKSGRCNIVLDEQVVERLLQQGSDKDLLKRYSCRLVDTYVNNNPTVKWCPFTDCTNAVRITSSFDESSFETVVMCSEKESEGHKWCFNCREEPHVPADCEDVRKWRKKCRDDSETCNWLQANTKDCPKCRVAINKDGGCNHIHCKQCDYHFCWVCLGTFEHTTYQHSCNKFAADDSNVTSSRSALERYMHHFERFSNHLKSRELESKLREMTLLKMNEMQEKGNKTYIDVQFMQQATSQLIKSRQTLQWTYVVGFYLPKWLVKNIFEMNQGELETATERLSNMLEVEDVLVWCNEDKRVEMISQTSDVKRRLEHLFQHLEEWKANYTRLQDSGDGDTELADENSVQQPKAGDVKQERKRKGGAKDRRQQKSK